MCKLDASFFLLAKNCWRSVQINFLDQKADWRGSGACSPAFSCRSSVFLDWFLWCACKLFYECKCTKSSTCATAFKCAYKSINVSLSMELTIANCIKLGDAIFDSHCAFWLMSICKANGRVRIVLSVHCPSSWCCLNSSGAEWAGLDAGN